MISKPPSTNSITLKSFKIHFPPRTVSFADVDRVDLHGIKGKTWFPSGEKNVIN